MGNIKKELEKGDYVRFKRHKGVKSKGINKIVAIEGEGNEKVFWFKKSFFVDGDTDYEGIRYVNALYEYQLEDEIKCYSPDIRDVLMVGDLVDGYMVVDIGQGMCVQLVSTKKGVEYIPLEECDFWRAKILTREEYSEMAFFNIPF